MSKIIFLNGCGSSGKTSIAKAIQYLSNEPWLRIGVDNLIDMMPERYTAFGDRTENGYFSFVPGTNNHGSTMHVDTKPNGKKIFGLMPKIASMLVDQGNNIIIDEVLFGDDILKLYAEELNGHAIYFVGIICDLIAMQEREILRGDRAIGLSNDQIDIVHAGFRKYDLKIDTTNQSPFAASKLILDFIDNNPNHKGLKVDV